MLVLLLRRFALAKRPDSRCSVAALDILTYTNKKAGCTGQESSESAIANAEHNDGADIDDLKVTKIFADEGPSMKRIMPCKAVVQIAS